MTAASLNLFRGAFTWTFVLLENAQGIGKIDSEVLKPKHIIDLNTELQKQMSRYSSITVKNYKILYASPS